MIYSPSIDIQHIGAKMANDKQDTSLPHELSLDRVNHLPDIDRAIETVNEYLPIPKFEPSRNGPPFSTTVISAFFPPPPDEPLQRGMKNGRGRGVDEYLHGLKVMAETSQYLVVFVPPGDIAESLRSMNRTNVVVLDHYTTLWEIPHLQGKREEFYGRQVELLAGAYPPQEAPYGEPHSWGAWNAKSFLILEALRLDPFQSSHFVWLDARVPGFRWARGVGTNTSPIGWPTPHAIRNAYDAIYNADRAIVFALDRPLRTPDTPYWPRLSISGKNTGGHMTDIHAVYGGMVLGNKSAMARLARALLILVERDLARGRRSLSRIRRKTDEAAP